MNNEKAERLTMFYPMLFRKDNGEIRSVYESFPFECGSGWFELINELCQEISTIVRESNKEVWPRVVQVKEKFGGLRFYISNTDFSVAKINESEKIALDAVIEKINQLIIDAQSKSFVTCEDCGLPGKCYSSSWIHVKCPACEAMYKNNRETLDEG